MRAIMILVLAGCAGGDVEETTAGLLRAWVDADADNLSADVDCDDADPAVGLPPGWYLDRDRDGYGDPAAVTLACEAPEASVGPGPADCNDRDARARPGGDEVCDGVDNDCDGHVDEGASGGPTWYADVDGDDWGDSAWPVVACVRPGGFASQSGDCDDSNDNIHPGAYEDCGSVDLNCDGSADAGAWDAVAVYADGDNDGYGDVASELYTCSPEEDAARTAGDCDDGDPGINPLALEVCDGADNDCDGDADEGLEGEWFFDADGDGYGDGKAATACAQPPGFAALDGDCDDGDAGVNPVASELCGDGVDNDCDGAELAYYVWYEDVDGDSYGDAASSMEVCDQPDGFVTDDTDCDDADPTTSPGADELCDSRDNNCDGIVDDNSQWFADADGDGWGDPASSIWDCKAPVGYLADASDCDDTDQARAPDNMEICDGLDNDCDGVGDGWICGDVSTADADSRWLGEDAYDRAGAAVAWVGDADGDGLDDLLVGAYGQATGGNGAGAAYLVTDAASAGRNDLASAERFTGEVADDTAGIVVSGAGDIDGDGYADLLIGARDHDERGAAYLVLGGTGGGPLSGAEATLLGESSGDGAGRAVAGAGDVDGDGYEDLLIGAYANDAGGVNAGAAYLVYGPVTGDVELVGDAAAFEGTEQSWAGWAVAGGGDMDGDGLADLAIGAPTEAGIGAVWIVSGGALSGGELSADADRWLQGQDEDDDAGEVLAPAGDVDGDGLDDLLVGAPGRGAGGVYVVLGGGSGVMDLGDAWAVFAGEDDGDRAGSALGAADLDSDGGVDLAVGATGSSDDGRIYLVMAPASGAWSLAEAGVTVAGDGAVGVGGALAVGGDADGDGLLELAVGAHAEDEGGSNAGAIYLFQGATP